MKYSRYYRKTNLALLLLCFICGMTLLANTAHAQNGYLWNGHFEKHTICPLNFSTTPPDPDNDWLYLCQTGWERLGPGTPDYFNLCGGANVLIPNNDMGYQWDATYGSSPPLGLDVGYAGLYVGNTSPPYSPYYREYIHARLISPNSLSLQAPQYTPLLDGHTYTIKFRVSPAEDNLAWTERPDITIGAYLTTADANGEPVMPTLSNTYIFPVTPQVVSSVPLTDVTAWYTVQQTVTITGGNKDFIVIGNFQNMPVDRKYYYYIDDVEIEEAPCAFCETDFNVIFEPDPDSPPELCCYTIKVEAGVGACDVYGISLNASGILQSGATGIGSWTVDNTNGNTQYPNFVTWRRGFPFQAGETTTVGRVCLTGSVEPIQVSLGFFRLDGSRACGMTHTVTPCPASCCESLRAQPINFIPNGPCCYSFNVPLNIDQTCRGIGSMRFTAAAPARFTHQGLSLPSLDFERHAADPTIMGSFCLEGGTGSTQIKIEYLDHSGQAVCVVNTEVTCPQEACCDAIQLNTVLRPTATGECCFDIFASQDFSTPRCDIYGIYLLDENGVVIGGQHWGPNPVTLPPPFGLGLLVGNFCVPAGQTGTRYVRFIGANNQILCTKEVVETCEPSCCVDFNAAVVNNPFSPVTCCYDIRVNQVPESECALYGIRLLDASGNVMPGGIPYNPPPSLPIVLPAPGTTDLTIGSLCVTAGQTGTVTVQFLGADGSVLCTRELSKYCPNVIVLGKDNADDQQEGGSADVLRLSCAPNPVSDEATIYYTLRTASTVRLELFNSLGQPVALLDEGAKTQGIHSIPCKTAGLTSGTYLLRLTSNGGSVSIPVTISR